MSEPFKVGDIVECISANWSNPGLRAIAHLPRLHVRYRVREVVTGFVDAECTIIGEPCLLLVELVNWPHRNYKVEPRFEARWFRKVEDKPNV